MTWNNLCCQRRWGGVRVLWLDSLQNPPVSLGESLKKSLPCTLFKLFLKVFQVFYSRRARGCHHLRALPPGERGPPSPAKESSPSLRLSGSSSSCWGDLRKLRILRQLWDKMKPCTGLRYQYICETKSLQWKPYDAGPPEQGSQGKRFHLFGSHRLSMNNWHKGDTTSLVSRTSYAELGLLCTELHFKYRELTCVLLLICSCVIFAVECMCSISVQPWASCKLLASLLAHQ